KRKFEDIYPAVSKIEKLLKNFPPPGMKVYLTGIPVIRKEIVVQLMEDQILFFPLCTFTFLLVLFYLFRSWKFLFFPFIAIFIAIVCTLGLMGWMGKEMDIINNILPTLIFTIAISDSIHLLNRYENNLINGMDKEKALLDTVKHLAWACFFTSFTTAVGFASLVIAEVDILRSFGFYAALGVIFGYISTMLVLPPLLYITSPPRSIKKKFQKPWQMKGLNHLVFHYPLFILGFWLLIILGMGYVGSKVEVNNFLMESFSKEDPLFKSSQLLETKFSGMIPMAVLFKAKEKKLLYEPSFFEYMDQIAKKIRKGIGMNAVISPADLVKEVNSILPFGRGKKEIPNNSARLKFCIQVLETKEKEIWQSFFKKDLKMARILGYGRDVGAKKALVDLRKLEKYLVHHPLPGFEIQITDVAPVAAPALQKLVSELRDSLFLAFVIIFITMGLLFRSYSLGLVSIVPNIAPLVFALGALGLMGLDLQSTTIFVFPIALGLAVDDTIHFLTYYREKIHLGATIQEAIQATFQGAGKAIIFTSVLLGLGFGVILFSHFPITRRFAILMEVILGIALLADLTLLPACIYFFKIKNGKEK
ncbi:MAG: hypothetical protein D6785_06505, partial [Planctomycetota bacterium]